MILTSSHILAVAGGPAAGETGFSGITPGGPLIAIGAALALLLLGIVAALLTLRGAKHGTEGTRRARRGFGPDALDAAARELRPSRTGATAAARCGPFRNRNRSLRPGADPAPDPCDS